MDHEQASTREHRFDLQQMLRELAAEVEAGARPPAPGEATAPPTAWTGPVPGLGAQRRDGMDARDAHGDRSGPNAAGGSGRHGDGDDD